MQEPNKKWDIYYCGDDAVKKAPKKAEPRSATPDIPISKRDVSADAAAETEEPYTNDYSADDGYRNAFSRFWLKKNHRNLKLFVIFLLLALLIAAGIFVLVITHKLNLIEYESGVDFEHADQTDVVEEEDLVFTPMHSVTDASSLRDWLQKWALNGGEKMHSKNVINCLLCGVDTQEETSGRTDAMILVSINKRSGKIMLASFMRDSYTYMDINGQDRWYKINSAYNWGGAGTLVETIENNYKIEIDNYITVDFDTFPQLIDALGGVNVDVEEYEAKYIRRTSSHKKFPYGEQVRLNGDQALIYSRIRHSDNDGDLSRTRRQRKLIMALIEKAKTASVGQLNAMLNTVLPYVQTNYHRPQILSLGTQAIMQNWMRYDIEQISCPLLLDSEDGTQKLTGKDSYLMTGYGSREEFVWVVDYQMDAQRLQTALYGSTNIRQDADRESPFDFLTGNGSVKTTNSYSYTTTSPYGNAQEDPAETEPTTRLIDRITNIFDPVRRETTTDAPPPAEEYTPEEPPNNDPESAD